MGPVRVRWRAGRACRGLASPGAGEVAGLGGGGMHGWRALAGSCLGGSLFSVGWLAARRRRRCAKNKKAAGPYITGGCARRRAVATASTSPAPSTTTR